MPGAAANLDKADLALCAAEIGRLCGTGSEIKLVNKRRSREGWRIKVAVQFERGRAGGEGVAFATCWISSDGTPGMDAGGGSVIRADVSCAATAPDE